jgi:hypothetical protein
MAAAWVPPTPAYGSVAWTLHLVQDELTNKVAARQMAYFLFWNLRSATSGLTVTQTDVEESAARAGLKHTDTAWGLLDRNGDLEVSFDEVVNAVEDVYDNRRTLAATLRDNQTVVAQVERLIWVTLNVVLLFIVVAIFDAGSLQRTWTGLSAGLLSFSFIFSNSIRTVRPRLRSIRDLSSSKHLPPLML